MLVQKFFHLDCNPIVPECGYECAKCIQEIRSVVGGMDGVSEVSTRKRGEISVVVVQYDPEAIADDHLMNTFSKLPSFYRGRFVPKVLDA